MDKKRNGIKYYILIILMMFLIMGCDTFTGIIMRYHYDIETPMEKIYLILKDNLNCEKIELVYIPSKESFEIFPNFGKKILNAYERIYIDFDNCYVYIEYINKNSRYSTDKDNYLLFATWLRGRVKKNNEIIEPKMLRFQEIKNCLLENYSEYFIENNFNIIIQ